MPFVADSINPQLKHRQTEKRRLRRLSCGPPAPARIERLKVRASSSCRAEHGTILALPDFHRKALTSI